MNSQEFDSLYRGRLQKLATSNLSDALDRLGISAAIIGIVPQWGKTKIIGRAITIRMIAAGAVQSKAHLGVDAIYSAEPGDVIAIDNRGDLNNNCWGEILSMGALQKKISGVVVDGAVRDVDTCEEFGFLSTLKERFLLLHEVALCRRLGIFLFVWAIFQYYPETLLLLI